MDSKCKNMSSSANVFFMKFTLMMTCEKLNVDGVDTGKAKKYVVITLELRCSYPIW